MGYADVIEAQSQTGAAGAPGVNAAARLALETETWLVASSAGGAITVTDGEIMAIDTTSLAGSVRSRVAVRAASATIAIPVGVAFLDAPVVIPQTAVAGDIMVPIRVMRRGFHNAVAVATGGAANNVVFPSATAGRGSVPVATTALAAASGHIANCVGVTLGAAAANVAPMWVCCQFG